MPRYTDVDALLSKLSDDLPYKASVKRVLMQAPAADVVPKSEVAREIFEEIEKYWIDSDTLPDCARLVDLDKIAELKKKYLEE